MSTRYARGTVLVTGASGVVGSSIARELADFQVIGLVHRTSASGAIQSVKGNITQPRLGLSEADYRELCARVDIVVHSAGNVDFTASLASHQAINVVGTQRILELAEDAQAPIHHVSTAYIRALASDCLAPIDSANVVYSYVSTKLRAERLVSSSGLPCSIYRPSNLIGDSRTGEIPRKQMVPQMASGLLRGQYPVLPSRPGALLDLVPADVCGQAIAAAARAGDIGSEYWLSYGSASPSIGEIVELCREFAGSIGQKMSIPQIVDPDDEEAVREALARLPRTRRPFVRMILPRFISLAYAMAGVGVVPSSLDALTERYGLVLPDLREALMRGLSYLQSSSRRRK